MNIQEYLGSKEDGQARRKLPPTERISKHMKRGFRATKRYVDGRQKSAKNRRPMRKRK